MHHLPQLIIDLAIILGIAGITALIFQKIRQPVVLGYLVAGVIIGPYTPPYGLITDTPNIHTLSELGIIFLMFSLGLDFSFHKLKRVGFSAGITGTLEVLGMLLAGLAVGKLIGWSFFDSLFLGSALAMSSTTIIIKAVEELKLKTQSFAEVIFGILIVEDLLAILMLVGLSTIVMSSNIFSMELAGAAFQLFLVVGGWFIVGYFLVPSMFRRIMPYINEETLTIVSVALCLFLVCMAAYFDYSIALGAFIMGSILAETPLIHRIEQVIKPIRDIFAAVFFVSVGMLIDPYIIIAEWPVILLICLITLVGKGSLTTLGAFLSGQKLNNSLRIGMSMAQIGEFSFIIIGLGVSLNAVNDSLYAVIVAVSAITTFTTPYLIMFSGHFVKYLDQHLSTRMQYFFNGYTTWIQRIAHSPTHKPVYRRGFIRLILNGLLVGIIFLLTENLILPASINFIDAPHLEKIAAWAIAVLLASPFIWGMLMSFKVPTETLEEVSPHKPPALYLSRLVTMIEIAILSISYFDTWFIGILFLLIAVVFFSLLYKQLEKSYHWFETQLINNLRHDLQTNNHHALPNWDAEFIELIVQENSPLVGSTLNPQYIRQEYGINIIAVVHDAQVVLMSQFTQTLPALAHLIVLGEEGRVQYFVDELLLERL